MPTLEDLTVFLFQYEMKQNFRETKRNEISHIFVSRNKRNFRETGEAFVSFRVSRNK
jgi:hypothetical protein